jgi:unsaturated rhamnogalacturonyl hydrolase
MRLGIAACGVVVLLFCANVAQAQPEFTADSVKNMCKRVASGRLSSRLHAGWQVGTYFEGVMALYDMTKEKKYLDSTVAWGTFHNWLSASADSFPTNYDNVCCYQAYLESYLADPKPANLPHVQAALNYIKQYTYKMCPNKCGDVAWPIVDMFHMAGPSYPRAAAILKDSIILDSIYKFSVMNAKHHYNVKFHLFNSNCSDTNTTRDWWGRGCGWGVCAICRIHQYLPVNHSGRAWFEQKMRETCAKLLTLQNQTDGMWRSNLFLPDWNKEASGTGFFCYELFYALRNGIIDTMTYLGPAKKAWKGLIGCVGVDPQRPNLIGWSQGVGGGPANDFTATNHDEYTEGAFLMAGNEFYNFLTKGSTAVRQSALKNDVHSSPVKIFQMLCIIGNPANIKGPHDAIGYELYSSEGRKVGGNYFTSTGVKSVSVPVSLNKILIAKFLIK